MQLPRQYMFLLDTVGPKILHAMLALYGTKEAPGPKNNSEIMKWAAQVGVAYDGDHVAWCGLAIAKAVDDAGFYDKNEVNGNPLWARNWLGWGTKQNTAMLGDVMVFARASGGHVALYVGEDDLHWHLLGGNQSDMVCFATRPKTPILGIRRCKWRAVQPPDVRRFFIANGQARPAKES